MANSKWTREETIVAFNVYCKIPFKNSSSRHPLVMEYAKIIGRSTSALNMKIGNFGRLDPELRAQGIVGLSNGAKMEDVVWNEFHNNWSDLAYESERLIAEFQNKNFFTLDKEQSLQNPTETEKERLVKTRVSQSFFRSTILSSYNTSCCITGISIPDLLIASHIIPWSVNRTERLNPRNGLCLNSLHDKAYDKGYITIDENYKIRLSKKIEEFERIETIERMFFDYEGKEIKLPDKFLPNKEFLTFHRSTIFLG